MRVDFYKSLLLVKNPTTERGRADGEFIAPEFPISPQHLNNLPDAKSSFLNQRQVCFEKLPRYFQIIG